MTEKLEKLIALAVTDGVITERELEILKKKAKEEGVDEDELEMLLDARLYEHKEKLKEEIKNSILPPPVKTIAEKLEIPVFQPENINTKESIEKISRF